MSLDKFAAARGFRPYWHKKPVKLGKVKPKTMVYEVDKRPLDISGKMQARVLDAISKDLSFPPLYIISSMPTDFQALRAAEAMFMASLKDCVDNNKLADRNMPYWHVLQGGFADEVRDNPTRYRNVPLLVLTNVVDDSTPTKIEKLRDILYTLPQVPKILVCSGCNAMEFAHKIKVSPSAVLHLVADKDIDIG